MKVSNIRKVTDKLELFDLEVADGIIIHGCSYKSGSGAKGPYEFIAMPQRKGKDREGNDKWYNEVTLSKEAAERALWAYQAAKNPEDEPF